MRGKQPVPQENSLAAGGKSFVTTNSNFQTTNPLNCKLISGINTLEYQQNASQTFESPFRNQCQKNHKSAKSTINTNTLTKSKKFPINTES